MKVDEIEWNRLSIWNFCNAAFADIPRQFRINNAILRHLFFVLLGKRSIYDLDSAAFFRSKMPVTTTKPYLTILTRIFNDSDKPCAASVSDALTHSKLKHIGCTSPKHTHARSICERNIKYDNHQLNSLVVSQRLFSMHRDRHQLTGRLSLCLFSLSIYRLSCLIHILWIIHFFVCD